MAMQYIFRGLFLVVAAWFRFSPHLYLPFSLLDALPAQALPTPLVCFAVALSRVVRSVQDGQNAHDVTHQEHDYVS